MLEIYATSIDYDSREEASQLFYATVQNKMHWAAHGHTAAEIVHHRADATKQNMGLTSWIGSKPSRGEAAIAKNYLKVEELEALNRIVNAYLEFAELQALNRTPMYMRDWIAKLDVKVRALYVRPMRNKWASCSTAGTLSFNDELLGMARELVDYVIVHELLHFSVPNYGKLWKSLMRAHLGEYEQIEARMKQAAS